MIDPHKYGTVTEAAAFAGVPRRTLLSAIARGDRSLKTAETYGGTPLVSIASAKTWALKCHRPKTQPTPEA